MYETWLNRWRTPAQAMGAVGGAVAAGGALLGLASTALPWISLDMLFVHTSLSLGQIAALADTAGPTSSGALIRAMLGFLLLVGLAGLAAGVVSACVRGLPARIAGGIAAAMGPLSLAVVTLSFLYIRSSDGWTTVMPGIGLIAAGLSAVLMIAGGVAALAGDVLSAHARPTGAAHHRFERTVSW